MRFFLFPPTPRSTVWLWLPPFCSLKLIFCLRCWSSGKVAAVEFELKSASLTSTRSIGKLSLWLERNLESNDRIRWDWLGNVRKEHFRAWQMLKQQLSGRCWSLATRQPKMLHWHHNFAIAKRNHGEESVISRREIIIILSLFPSSLSLSLFSLHSLSHVALYPVSKFAMLTLILFHVILCALSLSHFGCWAKDKNPEAA